MNLQILFISACEKQCEVILSAPAHTSPSNRKNKFLSTWSGRRGGIQGNGVCVLWSVQCSILHRTTECWQVVAAAPQPTVDWFLFWRSCQFSRTALEGDQNIRSLQWGGWAGHLQTRFQWWKVTKYIYKYCIQVLFCHICIYLSISILLLLYSFTPLQFWGKHRTFYSTTFIFILTVTSYIWPITQYLYL